MELTREFMLERFLARDAAWNGRFLTGVVTTGIYCLPSCTARKPRPENVRFFDTEDQARAAGLRACRRCRPHLFYTERDPDLERLENAVERLRARPDGFADVAALAAAAGMRPTKLHALVRRHWHATPLELVASARLDAARELLETSDRSAAAIAFEVGFESLSAFHAHFRRRNGLAPGAWRRMLDERTFALELPPGFRADLTLEYLGRDPVSPTEHVAAGRYARALRLDGRPAVVAVAFDGERALCEVRGARPVSRAGMRAVHAALVRLFALDTDPRAFERRVARDPRLAPLVRGREGLRVPRSPDAFEMLCWTVIAQQVNLGFAFQCRRALVELAGPAASDGMVAHPTPSELARLDYADLERLRLTRRKSEYLIDAARAIESDELDLEGLAREPATRAAQRLASVRGLGRWSVGSILMRGLGFADCIPVGDAGLVRSLESFFELAERPDADRTAELMAPFAPQRSLASFHFWRRLEETP